MDLCHLPSLNTVSPRADLPAPPVNPAPPPPLPPSPEQARSTPSTSWCSSSPSSAWIASGSASARRSRTISSVSNVLLPLGARWPRGPGLVDLGGLGKARSKKWLVTGGSAASSTASLRLCLTPTYNRHHPTPVPTTQTCPPSTRVMRCCPCGHARPEPSSPQRQPGGRAAAAEPPALPTAAACRLFPLRQRRR